MRELEGGGWEGAPPVGTPHGALGRVLVGGLTAGVGTNMNVTTRRLRGQMWGIGDRAAHWQRPTGWGKKKNIASCQKSFSFLLVPFRFEETLTLGAK